MVMYGGDPTAANWSALRALVYANIATLAAGVADPQIGGLYLGVFSSSRVCIGSEGALHQVAAHRGILGIVTFSLDCVSTSQA